MNQPFLLVRLRFVAIEKYESPSMWQQMENALFLIPLRSNLQHEIHLFCQPQTKLAYIVHLRIDETAYKAWHFFLSLSLFSDCFTLIERDAPKAEWLHGNTSISLRMNSLPFHLLR